MNKEEFIKELKKINIDISNNQLEKLDKFKELLKEYNQKFNLTTIIKDNDIYLKHFYDSLYLMTTKEFKNSSSILDIGVGAGFPGIPLAILNEDKDFTLIESSQKKCNFINIVKEKLSLSNITIINFYQKFPSGVISLTEVVGLISFTLMFIAFTIMVMQRRKLVK